MAKRSRHPHKDIESAVQYAESRGWEYQKPGSSSHVWGKLYCPLRTTEGHKMSIFSTPRNPTSYAKRVKKQIDKCNHGVES